MPLDPEIAALVDAWYALGVPRIDTMSPADWRRRYAELRHGTVDLPVRSEDRTIPGPAVPVPVRIYRPAIEEGSGLLVYFHGGGWVVGSVASHDERCRRLCHGARSVVMSVDYRLAPEHPYPAAVEDCYAATMWATQHATELGVDASRIAVGGDSAGGNLAAVVALMARDRNEGNLCFQVLVYPAVDRDFDRPSCIDNAEGYMFTTADMRWYVEQYASDPATHRDPYFAPLRADSLEGLPAALVITAEFDPLRDEGNEYAARLIAAGVETQHICYEGAVHGFLGWSHASAIARSAIAEICKALRSRFA
ncbi:MAG: alpha/beta hydrolase [Myxococcota bacterium]